MKKVLLTMLFSFLYQSFVLAEENYVSSQLDVVSENSSRSYLLYVHATKQTDGVIVSGLLKKRRHSVRSLLGHIHVEFMDNEGRLLATKKINLPGVRWGKHQHSKRFSRLFKDIPKEAWVVKVKNHFNGSDEHDSLSMNETDILITKQKINV